MELEDLPEATLADRSGSTISGTCVTFEPASAATDVDAVVISMSFVIVSMTVHCIQSEFETLAEALNKGVIGQGKKREITEANMANAYDYFLTYKFTFTPS